MDYSVEGFGNGQNGGLRLYDTVNALNALSDISGREMCINGEKIPR